MTDGGGNQGPGQKNRRVSFDLSHNKSIPHPAPPPQAANREVDITMGHGTAVATYPADEKTLCQFPFFHARITSIRYSIPDNVTISLTFDDIHPDGGVQVLNWMHGRKLHGCLKKCPNPLLEARIQDMYNAASQWKLDALRVKILKLCQEKLRKGRFGDIHDFVKMLSNMYMFAPAEDHDGLSDTINAAIKYIPVKHWWSGIKYHNDGSFYHRVAGITFRSITDLVCDDCSLGMQPKHHGCIICGQPIHHTT
ncbi:hypothetical protein TWF718_005363 [Orbilia javanica]|uniref:Uncharacterized protein n=1 Tax=Orbilia javanica TaxID=47235 RepID=A0AAN8MUV0_9PEZI